MSVPTGNYIYDQMAMQSGSGIKSVRDNAKAVLDEFVRLRCLGRDEGLDAAVRVIESRYAMLEPSPEGQQLRGYLSVLVEAIRAMRHPVPKPTLGALQPGCGS